MIDKISQSFMKTYRGYLDGNECGIIIHEMFVNGREIPSEEPGAMELGTYFEFMGFGTLPKSGKVPMPVTNERDGKPNAEYRKAAAAALIIKDKMNAMGLEIFERGKTYHHGRFKGTIDLGVRVTKPLAIKGNDLLVSEHDVTFEPGQELTIDTKYAATLRKSTPMNNKHGWKWSNEQKAYHGVQAKQYKMIAKRPFLFWVTEHVSKEGDLPDMAIFYVPVTDEMIERHVAEGNYLFENFLTQAKVGFIPRPSMHKCDECPLRMECSFRATVPTIELIQL